MIAHSKRHVFDRFVKGSSAEMPSYMYDVHHVAVTVVFQPLAHQMRRDYLFQDV